MPTEGLDRAGDECYWCGGVADGGSIRVKISEDAPERETCQDCLREWPPEGVSDS